MFFSGVARIFPVGGHGGGGGVWVFVGGALTYWADKPPTKKKILNYKKKKILNSFQHNWTVFFSGVARIFPVGGHGGGGGGGGGALTYWADKPPTKKKSSTTNSPHFYHGTSLPAVGIFFLNVKGNYFIKLLNFHTWKLFSR